MLNDAQSTRFTSQNSSQYSQNYSDDGSAGLLSRAEFENPQTLNSIFKKVGINPLEKDLPENQDKIRTLEKLMHNQGMFNDNFVTDGELSRVDNWIDNPIEAPDSVAGFADELSTHAQGVLAAEDTNTQVVNETETGSAVNPYFKSGAASNGGVSQGPASNDLSDRSNEFVHAGASSTGENSQSAGAQGLQDSGVAQDVPRMRSIAESTSAPPTTRKEAPATTDMSGQSNEFFGSGASSNGGASNGQNLQDSGVSQDVPRMRNVAESSTAPLNTGNEAPATNDLSGGTNEYFHAGASSNGGISQNADAQGLQGSATNQPTGNSTPDGVGSPLDFAAHDSAFQTMNANGASIPTIDEGVAVLDAQGAYNANQPDDKKITGSYLALNTLAKLQTMPSNNFPSEAKAAEVYGSLKVAGMNGDGDQIRSIIADNGGTDFGLNNKQLVDLWGVNEYEHLHPILDGNDTIRNSVSMTSLNMNDEWTQSDGPTGTMGGYNNKGEYPQWGWFESAQQYSSMFAQ